jgi:uncharacterized alpha-E superfamily protein
MDAGRRIERGLHLATLLRATATVDRGQAADSLLMESILTAAESIITYRRRYRSTAQVETMLDLMLLDPDNPRSMTYQLDRILEDLRALPGSPGAWRAAPAEKPALAASTALRVVDTAGLAVGDSQGRRPALDDFLSEMVDGLHLIDEAVRATYFPRPVAQRAFLTPADPDAARASHRFWR